MPSFDYDLFTFGAGSGGVRASRFSANLGAKVAVAESRFMGGTCVNVGCVPKKLMVYASHVSHDLHDAQGFGWSIPEASFDWPTFLARKDAEIARLNGIYRKLLVGAGVEVFDGHARLLDPHTVEVASPSGEVRRVRAKNILIATGGEPVAPSLPGAEHAIVSDHVFRLPEAPKRLVVVGGGYIAVEFAGIFRGLGAEVTLLHRGSQLLRGFDEELCAFLTRELEKKGIQVLLHHNIEEISLVNGVKHCRLNTGETREADLVLFAIGRRPKTAGLGLESAGIKLNGRGAVEVNERFQTAIPHIYAIGDVIDRVNLTPVALAQGMLVARSLFGGQEGTLSYENIPTAVFSQPPLSSVGLTESEARARFSSIEIYATEFTPMKGTLSGNKERTLMKLVVEKPSGKVLGVHMVGTDAPEMIQMAAVALQCGATKAQFDATIGIHPTAAEEFVTLRTPRAS
jgi:glutathione reductase (NADPH)